MRVLHHITCAPIWLEGGEAGSDEKPWADEALVDAMESTDRRYGNHNKQNDPVRLREGR